MKPERVGPSGLVIGTHAHHLACFVTGQNFASVSADVGTLLPGRKVHDVAQVRFRLAGGARGQMEISNAAAGMSNDISLRVFGETGTWYATGTQVAIAFLDGELARSPVASRRCRLMRNPRRG